MHTNQCTHLSTEPNHRDFYLGACQNSERHVSKHAVFCTTPFNQVMGCTQERKMTFEKTDETGHFSNYMLFEIINQSKAGHYHNHEICQLPSETRAHELVHAFVYGTESS